LVARITVVNDNPEFLDLVREILEDDRHDTTTLDGDRQDVLHAIRASDPELLMIDLRMKAGVLHGWDVAQAVRRDASLAGVPILVCSGDVQALRDIEDELSQMHQVRSVVKPFGIDELTDAIDGLLAEHATG
jgi:CheY-like chemotaxis protein